MNQAKKEVIKKALKEAKGSLKYRYEECDESYKKVQKAQIQLKYAQKGATELEERIRQLSNKRGT